MPSLLLAESGSTKTDWCLLQGQGEPVHFKTSGINPYLQTPQQIADLLTTELPWQGSGHSADAICFYGAGAGSADKQQQIAQILESHFKATSIEAQGDMMAAARGLCGNENGIVCILGTGSNSCFYNGNEIQDQQTSLGYIAGDEGSGNYIGKRVLQYYAYRTFDAELMMAFEQLYGSDINVIKNRLYHEPFPNRYLATFVQLLLENRGHFMVENIIEDSLNDFFHHHVVKYRESWKYPIHFTGSVAYEFKDVIAELCNQYELELGKIEKSPLPGLISYHSRQM